MFRKFAAQLEGGLNQSSGKDSSRIFDRTQGNRRVSKGEKGDGSRSLPEVKGSGRMSKPPRAAEVQEAS